MALDVRQTFVVGVAAYVITRYYIEKQLENDEIFWIYTGISLVLAVLSAYTVIIENTLKGTFIPLTAISILLALIYLDSEGEVSSASS